MSSSPPKGRIPPAKTPAAHQALRGLPQVDSVLRSPAIAAMIEKPGGASGGQLPRWAVVQAVRDELAELRRAVLEADTAIKDGPAGTEPLVAEPAGTDSAAFASRIGQRAAALVRPTLRRVVNATGVVLHTNLGRAPLPTAALRRIAEVAGGYSNLEYDLVAGTRGSRQAHLDSLLAGLTGAAAHLVVNNNAAAVLLTLAATCSGREVVVSRGELVEIGGSFRVPDVMRASGARLVEVGTTNRTHLRDYQRAVSETGATRAFLKVHRGNFAMVGFVAEVAGPELARCAHERGLLALYDLGSGALVPPPQDAAASSGTSDGESGTAAAEPIVREAVAAGFDAVTFSCDKLLGGPQAGVIAGSAALIDELRQHPLLRALRPDKLALAGLAATLELYRDGRRDEIPTLRMMTATADGLRLRAERLAERLRGLGVVADILPTQAAVGGGSLPLFSPKSYAVSPRCTDEVSRRLEAALRSQSPPVLARIERGRLLCDLRTLLDDEELELVARGLAAAFSL